MKVVNTLDNKIALVTGASRGIGKAVAINMAKKGAYVIGTATKAHGADNISQMFKEENLKGEGVILDVTKQEDIDNLLSKLADQNKIPAMVCFSFYINGCSSTAFDKH